MEEHSKLLPLFLSDPGYNWLRCIPTHVMTEIRLNKKYSKKAKNKKS